MSSTDSASISIPLPADYDLPWSLVELDLIRRVQANEAAKGTVRTKVATAYGAGHILEIRTREIDDITVVDLHVKLPYGDGFLAVDALSGNPIRFKPDDKVSTPFGPGRVQGMRITEHSKLYEVALVDWTLSGGDFARAILTHEDVTRRFISTLPEALSACMAAKARGNKAFGAGDFAGALLAYQEAITALDMCIKQNTREQLETVPADVWPSVFHALAVCHSNAAQSILKLPTVQHKEVLIHAQTAMAFLKDRVIPEVLSRKDMAQARLTKAIADAKKAGAADAGGAAGAATGEGGKGGAATAQPAVFGGLPQLPLLQAIAADAPLEPGRELPADAFQSVPAVASGTACVILSPSGTAVGVAKFSTITEPVLVTEVYASPADYPSSWAAAPESSPAAISAAKRAVQAAKEEWDIVKAEAAAKEKLHSRTMLRLGRGLVLAGELKTAFAVLTDGRLRGEAQALTLARQVKARLEVQSKKDKARWGGALKKMGSGAAAGAQGGAGGVPPAVPASGKHALSTPPAEIEVSEPGSVGEVGSGFQQEELAKPCEEQEGGGFLGLSGGVWGALAVGAAVVAGATYAGGLWGNSRETASRGSSGSGLRK